MTSRELVKAALTFSTPDRLPTRFASFGASDTHHVKWNQKILGNRYISRNQYVDLYGCVWTKSELKNMGQVTGHPLEDWEDFDAFPWPDVDHPRWYEGMEERFAGSEGKYVTTGIFMLLFERMQSLRGFENLMMDFYLERENVERLADKLVDIALTVIDNIARRFPGKIDGFSFTDDWGSQTGLLINPALWREFFKPRYRKIFDACKRNGWDVWMHSCGRINDILGDLIELGLDSINIEQPRALGIEEIGRQFAGKICFETTCDIQNTLPFCTEAEIRQEAKLLMDCWGTPEGGFLIEDYGDDESIAARPGTKRFMFDAFRELDRWKK